MKFKFIGKDGSMGLKKGSIHTVKTSIKRNLLWVTWEDNYCAYSSLEKFFENWEMAGEQG